MIKDNELLEKYSEIWEKVENNLKKEFDSEPVYNEKYLKAKIKSYNWKINANIDDDDNKGLKEGSRFISLSVILIDSVFRIGRNYYPQVFLKECKYVVKEKKITKHITDDLEISSDVNFSDKKYSYEESSD